MRVKHVHKPDMVAHLSAHQSQESARTANGNLYFRGDTIYSYGSHFPIAKHKAGVVLFTTKGYSVTTAGHISCVASACRHLTVFHVANVHGAPKEHLRDYADHCKALIVAWGKARSRKSFIFRELQDLVEEANHYAEHFKLKTRFACPDNMQAESDHIAEQNRIRDENQRRRAEKAWSERQARIEKERAERQAKITAALDAWVAGEVVDLPADVYYAPVRLRVVGDKVETSKGAVVPLGHATLAYRLIKQLRQEGKSYERNGHTIHIGHFALDSVDTDGNIRAGCHEIAYSEMERVATAAGIV